MSDQSLARTYAKSLMQLAGELKVDLGAEIIRLTELVNSSNHLENLLFLDVFTVEEKREVLTSILEKLNFSPLTKNAISFLIDEKRINLLPLITKEIVILDDHNKGFMRGIVEGADTSIDSSFQEKLASYLNKKLGLKVKLDYKQNDELTAGYRVTVEDLQLDASLDNQLNKFKESILNS